MADSPSPILLTREQSTGSNTNLWGGYLITTQRTTERASKGYQALAVTGDATISWTNYSATNDGAVAFLKLTGTLTSAATLTFPSYQHFVAVWNATGQSVTIKCSGGTGVTIPNGLRTLLYCDATDIYSAGSNWLNTYQGTLANNGDVVVMATLQTAIANASGLTAPFILVDASDTTPGYLTSKLTVSGALVKSITGSGGNEAINLAVGGLGLTLQTEKTAGFTAVAGNIYPVAIATTGTITFPASASNGDMVGIFNYGAGTVTFSWNGLKYYGATTTQATNAKGLTVFVYTNATTGWVEL